MPPSRLRGRRQATFYEYDDSPEGGGRLVRSWESPEWTPADRILMLGWVDYQASLCPKCGNPKLEAWHWDNDGEYEVVDEYECHACAALERHLNPDNPLPAVHPIVKYTRDPDKALPPFTKPGSGKPQPHRTATTAPAPVAEDDGAL